MYTVCCMLSGNVFKETACDLLEFDLTSAPYYSFCLSFHLKRTLNKTEKDKFVSGLQNHDKPE